MSRCSHLLPCFLQAIKTPPSTMSVEDRKTLDWFSDLYDKAEVRGRTCRTRKECTKHVFNRAQKKCTQHDLF